MSRLRIGIIGCGNMAGAHVSRFEGLEDRMVVTAAVDIDESRAEGVAKRFAKVKAATDYRDILAAGKHVLLEKPMANTEQEYIDIVEAAERSSSTLMIAYCIRFDPCVVRLKEVLLSSKNVKPTRKK